MPLPEPTLPDDLPIGLSLDRLRAWRQSLDDLPDDLARLSAVRDELERVRVTARYVTGLRAVFAVRCYEADVSVTEIGRAAGVRDTYVSRRAREVGLEPRLVRGKRNG